jgi:hypothetical protein
MPQAGTTRSVHRKRKSAPSATLPAQRGTFACTSLKTGLAGNSAALLAIDGGRILSRSSAYAGASGWPPVSAGVPPAARNTDAAVLSCHGVPSDRALRPDFRWGEPLVVGARVVIPKAVDSRAILGLLRVQRPTVLWCSRRCCSA